MTWSGASTGEHFLASNPPTLTAQNIFFLTPPSGGNDSTMIQAAIDACNAAGGGEVWGAGSYSAINLVLKEGVLLRGPASLQYPWNKNAFRINAFATGIVIDTPAGSTTGCGVLGVGLHGLGAGTAAKGIRFQNVTRGFIQKVTINNFADEGVLAGSSTIACTFEDIFAQNCLLNRTRGALTGAVDIDGTDHYLNRIEATISGSGSVTTASLFCGAIVVRGANFMCDSIIGEISDVGISLLGSSHMLVNSRADQNAGHGWNLLGSGARLSNCFSLSNSQDTTNTYDNFRADSASANNQLVNCNASDPLAKKAKYGFEDLASSDANRNSYVNCVSTTAVTAQYVTQNSAGSNFTWPAGGTKNLTLNSATPDVSGYERFGTNSGSSTTITDFTGGVQGQRLLIVCNDSNTTIQHNGATISLLGNGNRKLKSGAFYEFVKIGALWREVRSFSLGVSADNGDAAKSLQTLLNEETQIWATALTANRAVTLSTTGGWNGAKFRVVRKASATGASTLDVGTGPLKSLAVGQWCDVEYDGATWFLSAFGSL